VENREKAMLDYARVLELAPTNRHARLGLVELLFVEKNLQEAGEHLKIIRQNPENDPRELFVLARFESLQGNTEQARRFLDDLLAKKPDHGEGLYERGLLTEDLAEAEKYYRKALAGNEGYLQARFQLYNALLRQGRKQEADAENAKYKAYREDLEKLPRLLVEADRLASPDLLADAAAIMLRGSDGRQATQLLFRALHLSPNHKRSHALLADYYEKTKQQEKAARHRQLAGVKSP
jgi:cytochrome c-type biogenesis protein CcmH/NrfG